MSSVLIAGSRSITDYNLLLKAMEMKPQGLEITEVVSGKCPDGVDALGERWAIENNIPIQPFPAKWRDLSYPDAVLRKNKFGTYDAKAGMRRNNDMGYYLFRNKGRAIILYDNKSKGTKNMIQRLDSWDIPTRVFIIKNNCIDRYYDFKSIFA